jgi:RimJ/RimL family protein N-acetyltransferase
VQTAQSEGLKRIHAEVLAENLPMRRVCENVGFEADPVTVGTPKLTFTRVLAQPTS